MHRQGDDTARRPATATPSSGTPTTAGRATGARAGARSRATLWVHRGSPACSLHRTSRCVCVCLGGGCTARRAGGTAAETTIRGHALALLVLCALVLRPSAAGPVFPAAPRAAMADAGALAPPVRTGLMRLRLLPDESDAARLAGASMMYVADMALPTPGSLGDQPNSARCSGAGPIDLRAY